jgi:transposase InsO family protein
MAKSRLTPLKGSTIPRLELAGALEAVRLDKILRKELNIHQPSVFWVDSQIVLWYINSSSKRFQTYVANRVGKILEATEPIQWRYVPTEDNPGDDASRGLSATDLLKNRRWFHGPEFLKNEPHKWPTQPPFLCSELEGQLELKVSPQIYATKTEADHFGTLVHYFSSWFKLKRSVAWLKRFQQFLLTKNIQKTPISVSELQEAERLILLYAQGTLQNDKSRLKELKPIKTNDGLLRVGGRLENSQLKDEAKHPVILPYGHFVSKLIIQLHHHITGHAGVERVLAEIRRKYWIVRGRKLVKNIVYHCIPCKRGRGKMEIQQMADLPKGRVTPYEPPFTWVGVDYFGPFYVKRGRSQVKRYGCLFTCLCTRAIHIEVAHSLDTDSFINALERFIARRGEPKEIRSDNGTNFVGAQAELCKSIQQMNKGKIHEHLLKREIDWLFNPPGASHMGGVWERQIRTVRSVLTGVMKQQTLDDENLVTLLTVVEGIVNNRPITKLSDDPRDEKPLTPSHLLMLREGPTIPPGKFESKDLYRRRWRQVQYLANVFWRRWIREYLPALQKRQKWLEPRRNLKEGDLVIVFQHDIPRNQWPLGLVVGTHPGRDGLVRSVEVKTATGTYERPISKICLLEGTAIE